MIKIRLTIFVFLLFMALPGCMGNPGYLVRYGEKRLDYLRNTTEALQKECDKNGSELTEEKIKEKLGKPGFLKPVYETNLDLTSRSIRQTLRELNKDKGVLLKHHPDNLYDVLSDEDKNLKNLKLLSYVYDRMGSLEETALTFYLGSFTDTDRKEPVVLGWDYVKYDDKNRRNHKKQRKGFINYNMKTPADYLRLPYTFLIDTVIGLKQFAGEVVKSPLSFLEAELLENMIIERKIPFYQLDGFRAALEDWKNGITALTFRHRVKGNQGILASTQNLLGEIPLIGSVLDQRRRKENGTAHKLFLTRGIYGGDEYAQNTALWVDFFRRSHGQSTSRSDQVHTEDTDNLCVEIIPYRYGSNIDVLWALFNISHGYAYHMASEIVFTYDVNPGDSLLLSGHSGGVQRSMAAARILYDDGIKVNKMYGIAGPALGYAPCEETKVVLNGKFLDDKVSEISRFLRYITLDLLTLNIDWDDDKCESRRKEDVFYKHITPGFVDGRTRLKYDGYLNACLKKFLTNAPKPGDGNKDSNISTVTADK